MSNICRPGSTVCGDIRWLHPRLWAVLRTQIVRLGRLGVVNRGSESTGSPDGTSIVGIIVDIGPSVSGPSNVLQQFSELGWEPFHSVVGIPSGRLGKNSF